MLIIIIKVINLTLPSIVKTEKKIIPHQTTHDMTSVFYISSFKINHSRNTHWQLTRGPALHSCSPLHLHNNYLLTNTLLLFSWLKEACLLEAQRTPRFSVMSRLSVKIPRELASNNRFLIFSIKMVPPFPTPLYTHPLFHQSRMTQVRKENAFEMYSTLKSLRAMGLCHRPWSPESAS